MTTFAHTRIYYTHFYAFLQLRNCKLRRQQRSRIGFIETNLWLVFRLGAQWGIFLHLRSFCSNFLWCSYFCFNLVHFGYFGSICVWYFSYFGTISYQFWSKSCLFYHNFLSNQCFHSTQWAVLNSLWKFLTFLCFGLILKHISPWIFRLIWHWHGQKPLKMAERDREVLISFCVSITSHM